MELSLIQKIIIYAPPVIFAITVHEAAHGYAAKYFGDMTAFNAGRITLNPIKHIDLFGTILLPAITILLGGILFGWAKPVPVDFRRLRNPKKDMLWVAAAGPASNFVMAIFWALLIKFSVGAPEAIAYPLVMMAKAGVMINIVLMVLNLLPLPPLDGGRIAVSLLPMNLARPFAQIERFGFIILIALLFTGVLS
ncbi:MAG: site-2 protease family protein, partial [Methylotenera sp.]